MGYGTEREFWRPIEQRIRGILRPYLRHFMAEVMEVGTGEVRVKLPGEDLSTTDLPWATVYGSMPIVGDHVLTLVDYASRRVITSGSSSGGGSTGYMPYAYPIGASAASGAGGTTLALATATGSLAVPVAVTSTMIVDGISFWNTDAATQRGPVDGAIYEQETSTSSSLALVVRANLAAFTPSAATTRTVTLAATTLDPGVYWVGIMNKNASQTLGVGTSDNAWLSGNTTQTKTQAAAPFANPLDFATGWTKSVDLPILRLNGRVFNAGASF